MAKFIINVLKIRPVKTAVDRVHPDVSTVVATLRADRRDIHWCS